jgi:hypothetical protein
MEKDKQIFPTGLPLFEGISLFKEDTSFDPLPKTLGRVVHTAEEISRDPRPEQVDFLHAILCQVGMPRKHVVGRTFERNNGAVSVVLEAGRLYQRGHWVDMPLPYGTRPRLVMVYISSEAIRTKSRTIEIGESVYEFLKRLNIDPSGGPRGGYTMFKKQMEALVACRLNLGFRLPDRDITVNTQPISRFEAWVVTHGPERPLWPGVLDLSQEFFDTLIAHAVPLDHRALYALKHSALALDIYAWLAHRLCRITEPGGIKLSWKNFKEQFGQEYKDDRNFKKSFLKSLRQVHAVYPDAKLEQLPSGFILKTSPPPIQKRQILMPPKKSFSSCG